MTTGRLKRPWCSGLAGLEAAPLALAQLAKLTLSHYLEAVGRERLFLAGSVSTRRSPKQLLMCEALDAALSLGAPLTGICRSPEGTRATEVGFRAQVVRLCPLFTRAVGRPVGHTV